MSKATTSRRNGWSDDRSYYKSKTIDSSRSSVYGMYYCHEIGFSFSIVPQKPNATYSMRGQLKVISPSTGHIMKKPVVITKEIVLDHDSRGKKPYPDSLLITSAINIPHDKTCTEDIKAKIALVAEKLYQKYSDYLDAELGYTPCYAEITFDKAVSRYANKFISCQKYLNKDSRYEYTRVLKKLAVEFSGVKMNAISERKIKQYISNAKSSYYKNLLLASRFINYCQESSVFYGKNHIAEYLKKNKTKQKKSTESLIRSVKTQKILTDKQEKQLYKLIQEKLSVDGSYLGLALILGAGLTAKQSSGLTWHDIYLDECNSSFVRIAIKNEKRIGATHDYTRPCFPALARILNLRYRELKESYPLSVINNYPVASSKGDGIRIEAKELTRVARNVLSSIGINNASLSVCKNEAADKCIGGGVSLLLNTYKNSIGYVCGLERSDPGAFNFMLGQALTGDTTSDNYRSFTSPEGQLYLYHALQRDTKHEVITNTSSRKMSGIKSCIIRQSKPGFFAEAEITCTLEEGQTLTLLSEKGIELTYSAQFFNENGTCKRARKKLSGDSE